MRTEKATLRFLRNTSENSSALSDIYAEFSVQFHGADGIKEFAEKQE